MDRLEDLKALSWFPFNDEPLIRPSFIRPRLCDPVFLFPQESPDGRWHLFAHNWMGIEHYVSNNGVVWVKLGFTIFRAHSPFIFRDGGTYYLIYEKHDGFPVAFRRNRFRKHTSKKTESRIEVMSSTDLLVFSEPKVLLSSHDVPSSNIYLKKPRLSRPQLFREGDGYVLFYGSSNVVMQDSHQKATTYLCRSTSESIEGPYVDSTVVFWNNADSPYNSLAVGSVRILQLSDGYAGYECGFYYDRENRRSRSGVSLIYSPDGLSWDFTDSPMVFRTPERGWVSRYITSLDVRYNPGDQCFYMYYSANARMKKIPPVREGIGLLLGQDPKGRRISS